MPALSMFFGIIVRMQSERGGKHHKAHIHAIYNDYERNGLSYEKNNRDSGQF